DQLESHLCQLTRNRDDQGLVMIVHGNEDAPGSRYTVTGGKLGLGKSKAKRVCNTHDLPGGLHFRTEYGVSSGKLLEGEDRGFYKEVAHRQFRRQTEAREFAAYHEPRGNLRQRHAGGLADVRDGPGGTRIDFQDVDKPILNRILDVHQSDNIQFLGQLDSVLTQCLMLRLADRNCRENARTVSGVNYRLFDVLHNARDD